MNKKLIGQKIKEYRKRQNLTQEALGEKADLHYTYIGQVERGEKEPSFKFLTEIASALEISIDRLLISHKVSLEAESIISDINQLLMTRNAEELELLYSLVEKVIDIFEYSQRSTKIEKND